MDFFGGRPKKDGKDAFLKAQKEAREKREKQKKQEASAKQIQAFVRGAMVRHKQLAKLEEDQLKKLGDVQTLGSKVDAKTFGKVCNKVLKMPNFVAPLIFLKKLNAKYHGKLLTAWAQLLTASINDPDAQLLCILNKDLKVRSTWYPKIKKILLLLLENIFGKVTKKNKKAPIVSEEEVEKSSEIAKHLLIILIKINKDIWPYLEVSLQTKKDLLIQQKKFIKDDISNALDARIIQKMVLNKQFNDSKITRKFLLKLLCKREDAANKQMFAEFMGNESFYKDLKEMVPKKRTNLIELLLKKFEINSIEKEFDIANNFLVQFIEFCHFIIENIDKDEQMKEKAYEKKISLLNDAIDCFINSVVTSPNNKSITKSNIKEDVDSDEEQKSPTKEEIVTSSRKRQIYKKITSKNPQFYLTVGDNKTTISRFIDIIDGIFQTFQNSDFTSFSNIVSSGCELLLKFQLILDKADKAYYKNVLAFGKIIYQYPSICLKKQGYNFDSMFLLPEKYIPMIKVFSKSFYHTLKITDDEEFIGNSDIVQSKSLILTKIEIIELSSFLNSVLYQIIWKRIVDFESIKPSTIRLVKEIYNRDSRLKFCPKDFWIIPELAQTSEQLVNDPNPVKAGALNDILQETPHMLDFKTRLAFLHKIIGHDQKDHDRFPGFDPEYDFHDEDEEALEDNPHKDPKMITIRRDYLLEDGYDKITKRKDMRSVFMIRFVNEHGMYEEGIDGGGLLKEFITLVGKTIFDPNYGLFLEKEDKTLVPNPNSHFHPDHIKLFTFLGRLTGKAIYESILLESVFSVIFLNRILSVRNTINELKYADPEFYKNLMMLKHKKDIASSFGLTFSVDDTTFDNQKVIPLKPNGENIEVNEQNKLEYISLFCDYKLNRQIDAQSKAFVSGLKTVINTSWIKMFNHEELQYVISGQKRAGFDVSDLKANSVFNGFGYQSQTVKHFWEILEEMSDEQRSKFLLFVTGCSRPPTLGFKYLEPKMGIVCINSGGQETLPTASTCANLLKLPDYNNKEQMRKKLLYAINSNSGFDLG